MTGILPIVRFRLCDG